jgi:hypothetical protein
MGKKKGKGPAKAGGAAAAPVAATREELIAAALAPLSQTVSEEELEVAREVVLDELPKLRSAQSLSEALSSTLDDVGVDAGEHLEDITALMRKFRLGLANPIVTVDTTAGSFKCELFLDTMPVSASNFLDLVGTGFYDGLHVHRIVPEFMVSRVFISAVVCLLHAGCRGLKSLCSHHVVGVVVGGGWVVVM